MRYYVKGYYDHIKAHKNEVEATSLYDVMSQLDPYSPLNYDFEELEQELKRYGWVSIGDYMISIKKGGEN